MKRLNYLVSAVAVIGSLTFAGPGFAGDKYADDHGKHAKDWRHEHGGKRLEKMLDLTDAQKETLRSQRDGDKEARHALHGKIAEAHKSLMAAAESGANEAELSALAQTLGQLHAEKAMAAANAHKFFISVLTPGQKQKLADMKAKREAHKKSRDARQQSSSSVSSS